MAGTEVTTGKLHEVARNMEDLIARYNQSVERVYQIGGEIDGMWEGEAANKFRAIMGNDREKFNEMNRIVNAYIETLRRNAAVYEKSESDALNILSVNKRR